MFLLLYSNSFIFSNLYFTQFIGSMVLYWLRVIITDVFQTFYILCQSIICFKFVDDTRVSINNIFLSINHVLHIVVTFLSHSAWFFLLVSDVFCIVVYIFLRFYLGNPLGGRHCVSLFFYWISPQLITSTKSATEYGLLYKLGLNCIFFTFYHVMPPNN